MENGGWTVLQTSEWIMLFVILVSAGRSLSDMTLQEWRFQSPLKWNYGALHSSVAFEHFQLYAMKARRLRQLENYTDSTIDNEKLKNAHSCYLFFESNTLFSVCFSSLCFISPFHQIAVSLTWVVIEIL